MSSVVNKKLVFAAIFSLFFGYSNAQSTLNQIDSISSTSLKETRKIQVILPAGYDVKEKDSYDVIYVLDGEWYTELLPNAYHFAKSGGFVPNTILVLIPNVYVNGVNQRNRDFEPFDKKNGNGYASFLSFIEKELIPFIDKKYLNNGQRSILGSSLGGLFAVNTFLTNPDLFQAFLACDPNLDWEQEYLPKLAIKKLPDFNGKKSILFIATNDYSLKANGGYAFREALKAKAPKSLNWQVKTYQDETHYSLQYKAFYDALRYSYKGYRHKFDLFPQDAIIEPNKPLRLFIFNENPSVHFTLDGRQPTEESPRLSIDESIIITKPTTVKIKNLVTREQYADSASFIFKFKDSSHDIIKSEEIGDTSTAYSVYNGNWNELPPIDNMDAGSLINVKASDKTADSFNSQIYLVKKKFKVDENGYYIFAVDAPDGSRLYLGEKLLINNSTKPKSGIQSFAVYLKKGYYTTSAHMLRIGNAKKPGIRLFKTTRFNDRWWENEM